MMNKLYITATALVLVVILIIFLLWPKYQGLRELSLIIQKKETELQSKRDYFAQLRKISQRLIEYKESLSRVDSALPEEPSLPSLFDYFQKTSSQTGLLLEDIVFGGVKDREKGSKIKEIYISLILSGSYSDFKNFLFAIEKSAKLIEVEKIMFSTPKESGEPFSFGVNIKTYSY